MNHSSIVMPDLLAPYAQWMSDPLPPPLPVLAPGDSAALRLDFTTPDGAQASFRLEGAPAWLWFLAGAGTAAILFAALSGPKQRQGRW